MMSEPRLRWMEMAFSGEKKCLDPSRCEEKATPSSVSLRRPERLKTWKPPESVRMGRSQFMNLCRPPRRAIISSPGRMHRW
ncbi:hypothetical protein DSECCO2_483540 [anaerobic digester metagenome]